MKLRADQVKVGHVINHPQHGQWCIVRKVNGIEDGSRCSLWLTTYKVDKPFEWVVNCDEEIEVRNALFMTETPIAVLLSSSMLRTINVQFAEEWIPYVKDLMDNIKSDHMDFRVYTEHGSNGQEYGVVIPAYISRYDVANAIADELSKHTNVLRLMSDPNSDNKTPSLRVEKFAELQALKI